MNHFLSRASSSRLRDSRSSLPPCRPFQSLHFANRNPAKSMKTSRERNFNRYSFTQFEGALVAEASFGGEKAVARYRTPKAVFDRENCGALAVRDVRRRGDVLIGGRLRVAVALCLPMFVRLGLSVFRRRQPGATVAVARRAGIAEARDRRGRKQDQKQQSETDSHNFRLHKILSMASRGREGAPTYLLPWSQISCGEGGRLYSFGHFHIVVCSPLNLSQMEQTPLLEFSKM
jgi:hypothetical protein